RFTGREVAYPLERRDEGAAKPVEIREAHDLDDGRIPPEQARDRGVSLDDEDDRDAVLSRQLHLDAYAERRDARVCDDHAGSGDERTIDVVQPTRSERSV